MDNYSYSASKAAVHHPDPSPGCGTGAPARQRETVSPGVLPSKMTAHFQDQMEQMAEWYPLMADVSAPPDAAGTAIYFTVTQGVGLGGRFTIVLDGGAVATT